MKCNLVKKKNGPHFFVIHMHNLPKQRETRRVTQKTPLKKSLYIRCSYSWWSRSSKKSDITSKIEGCHEQKWFWPKYRQNAFIKKWFRVTALWLTFQSLDSNSERKVVFVSHESFLYLYLSSFSNKQKTILVSKSRERKQISIEQTQESLDR